MATSSANPIRVLFVEDSELDYELMLATLAGNGVVLEGSRVEDAAAMGAALAGSNWDAVISDHNLPTFSSGGALQVLRESKLDLPFLVVSGNSGEELAVEAMLAGADDYIMKGRLTRLVPALRRSLQAAAVRRERTAAEAALRESEARLRELTGHLEEMKETERAAVATEISEEIGSSLISLKFELAWLQRHSQFSAEAAERLGNAIALVERTAMTAQRVCGNLRPAILNEGIVPALEWFTAQFAHDSGIETHFDANRDETPGSAASIGIYRICEAALENVARHSGATRVEVNLFVAEDQIHVEITDNGKGIGELDSLKPSFGFAGMHERARKLNGTLDIYSKAGEGTSVLLSLPRTTRESPGQTGPA